MILGELHVDLIVSDQLLLQAAELLGGFLALVATLATWVMMGRA
jgi:hypothetical protein